MRPEARVAHLRRSMIEDVRLAVEEALFGERLSEAELEALGVGENDVDEERDRLWRELCQLFVAHLIHATPSWVRTEGNQASALALDLPMPSLDGVGGRSL